MYVCSTTVLWCTFQHLYYMRMQRSANDSNQNDEILFRGFEPIWCIWCVSTWYIDFQGSFMNMYMLGVCDPSIRLEWAGVRVWLWCLYVFAKRKDVLFSFFSYVCMHFDHRFLYPISLTLKKDSHTIQKGGQGLSQQILYYMICCACFTWLMVHEVLDTFSRPHVEVLESST